MKAGSSRVWSLRRRLGMDGNPLRRRCDRVQSALLAVAAFLFLAGCLAGVLVGRSSYRAGLVAEQRAAGGYGVTADVVSVGSGITASDGGNVPATLRVTWSDPAGRTHTQDVVTAAYPGERVRLWVDADGTASLKRHSHGQTVGAAVVSGLSTVVAVGSGLLAGQLGVALLVDRRRYALWEREWLVVEPGWRRQEL